MSDLFFEDLHLPEPDKFLGVGSASHAFQTADIMRKFEPVLYDEKPEILIVVGDVNSTLACGLVASKIEYDAKNAFGMRRPLIAHVEAGLRSFDRTMPEEINRVLTDHLSDLLFVTEKSAIENLLSEGITQEKIHFVGNTMIDSLVRFKNKAEKSEILNSLGLIKSGSINGISSVLPYVLLTLHRPSNVDDRNVFINVIEAMVEVSKEVPIIFPAHPRTQKKIKEYSLDRYFNFTYFTNLNKNLSLSVGNKTILQNGINIIEPIGYINFLSLMMKARIILTDSGGIQEETTFLGIPCVTLRENTERPVTVREGTNIIAGVKKENIINSINTILKRKANEEKPQYWDGEAANRILKVITEKLIIQKNQ